MGFVIREFWFYGPGRSAVQRIASTVWIRSAIVCICGEAELVALEQRPYLQTSQGAAAHVMVFWLAYQQKMHLLRDWGDLAWERLNALKSTGRGSPPGHIRRVAKTL